MIQRQLHNTLLTHLHSNKVIMLLGPRQVGKTTLLHQLFQDTKHTLWLNADKVEDRMLFENESLESFRMFFSPYKMLIIDEAQRIENIGLKLKIIYDNLPEIQLVVTGSSSFELANRINEPLTGRKFEFTLYPISFEEMVHQHGLFEEMKQLETRMLFGYYPEIIVNYKKNRELLTLLTNSYLYKDILEWSKIKKPEKIIKLLQALAFQIGNQVSYNELSQLVGLDNQTVENYILLLEQSFVIFRLNSFSRNLRNELKSSKKIYFYDLGIRNTLINNFNPLHLRNDVGALWENLIIIERKKYLSNHNIYTNSYFWRNLSQQEIDLVEERNGKLYAYEFKWNENKKVKIPNQFKEAYPNYEYQQINPKNYFHFITNNNESD